MAPNDDDGLIWEAQPAGLRRPVLVAAFEGLERRRRRGDVRDAVAHPAW